MSVQFSGEWDLSEKAAGNENNNMAEPSLLSSVIGRWWQF
jgi:hypothetical protein